ncbi:MAG: hypothetical protein ABJG15_12220 [Hyphomonadaceae bacterium]
MVLKRDNFASAQVRVASGHFGCVQHRHRAVQGVVVDNEEGVGAGPAPYPPEAAPLLVQAGDKGDVEGVTALYGVDDPVPYHLGV